MNSKLLDNPIGAIFFKKLEDGTLNKLRLYRIKSHGTSFIFRDKNNNKTVLSDKQVKEYTMLLPDGFISHTLVSDETYGVDTICLLHRLRDEHDGIIVPFAACRQNISDPLARMLNNDSNVEYVGFSTTKDNTIAGFDFANMCYAQGVRFQKGVFCYKEDTLDDILSFIDTTHFDTALSIIKEIMEEFKDVK